LAERVGEAVAYGTSRPGISADTIMDVIAGGAWYAVCVRRIKDVDNRGQGTQRGGAAGGTRVKLSR